MKGTRKFSRYLRKELKLSEFKKAFEKEGIYADLAIKIAGLRQAQGYTQQDLAAFLHTTQQTVSRIEDPRNNSLSINTLIKIAVFFKKGLNIEFV
jgi:DNA-binding XRE family transcriptional regulator